MDRKPLELIAIAISFLIPSWVMVVLRCYVRIWVKQFFGADDYLSVASLVCAVPIIYMSSISVIVLLLTNFLRLHTPRSVLLKYLEPSTVLGSTCRICRLKRQ